MDLQAILAALKGESLPATVAELETLRDKAQRYINLFQARHDAGEELNGDDVEALRGLVEGVERVNAAHAELAAAEASHAADVNELLNRAKGTADADAETDEDESDEGDADEDEGTGAEASAEGGADADEADADAPEALAASGKKGIKKGASFAGVGAGDAPVEPTGPGWEMVAGVPGYKAGKVGFRDIALAIDSVRPGSRAALSSSAMRGEFGVMRYAQLGRNVPLVEDAHALVAAISQATDQTQLPGGSLTASGGWCAPSEQLYDFCDVPDAVDLVSLPEITINRGGVRWPNEPDYSAMYDEIGFLFTEPELQAVDGDTGLPTAVKECVSIPCPDEFTEIRLNAIGFCVEAGILQVQGWPELLENFMRHATNAHLRKVSKYTVSQMVAGSTAIDLTTAGAASYVSATSTILNALALQAMNLRLNKGLARTATIEGVAPSWFAEVVKADFAQQEGLAVKDVSDAQVNAWLSARNIVLQYVADWQSRTTGLPGHMSTVAWPATVNILLYPAGTWFRSMSPVIEFGVMYPKEQLQLNRYTHMFTEDAIAVAKRCDKSLNVKLPLAVNGGIGQRYPLTELVLPEAEPTP